MRTRSRKPDVTKPSNSNPSDLERQSMSIHSPHQNPIENGNGALTTSPTSPRASTLTAHLERFTYTPRTSRQKDGNASLSQLSPAPTIPLILKRTRSASTDQSRSLLSQSLKEKAMVPKAEVGETGLSVLSQEVPTIASKKRKRKEKIFESLLTDSTDKNLYLLLVGHNPGGMTSTTGYAYAHPSNHFWKCLHASGITPTSASFHFPPGTSLPANAVHDQPLPPSATYSLPALYRIGNTNLCEKGTTSIYGLSLAENLAGAVILEGKVAKWRPEVIGVVGKAIWGHIFYTKMGRKLKNDEFEYGWQDENLRIGTISEGRLAIRARGKCANPKQSKAEHQKAIDLAESTEIEDATDWAGARIFVLTTTSGLAASITKELRDRVWGELGQWMQERRGKEEGSFLSGQGR